MSYHTRSHAARLGLCQLKVAWICGKIEFHDRWRWWRGKPTWQRVILALRGFRYGFLAKYGYYHRGSWARFHRHADLNYNPFSSCKSP
jgi:hypothetical protein